MLTGVKIHTVGPRELGDKAEFRAKKNQLLASLLNRKVISCTLMPTNGKLELWVDKAKFNASKVFVLACGINLAILKSSLGLYFQKTKGGLEGKVSLPVNAWVLLLFEESDQVAQGVLYWGKEAFLLKLGTKRKSAEAQSAKTASFKAKSVKKPEAPKEEPTPPIDPIRQFLDAFPSSYHWVMSWLRMMVQPAKNLAIQQKVIVLIPQSTSPSQKNKAGKNNPVKSSLIDQLSEEEEAYLAEIREREAAEEAEERALEEAALRKEKKRPRNDDLEAISRQESVAAQKVGGKKRKKRTVVTADNKGSRPKPNREKVWEDNSAPITKWYHSEPVVVNRGQVSNFCIANIHSFGTEVEFRQWLEQRFLQPIAKVRQNARLSDKGISESVFQLAIEFLKCAILGQVKQASNGDANYSQFSQACSQIRDGLAQCFTLQARCYNGNSAQACQEIAFILANSHHATELADQLVSAHLSSKQLQSFLAYISQLLSSGVR